MRDTDRFQTHAKENLETSQSEHRYDRYDLYSYCIRQRKDLLLVKVLAIVF